MVEQITDRNSQIIKTINYMINNINNNGNIDRTKLAIIRQSKNIDDIRAVKLWEFWFTHIPEQFVNNTDKPSYEENAIFSTIHCYAIYQGTRAENLNANKKKDSDALCLLNALGQLRKDPKLVKGISRRVEHLLLSTDFTALVYTLYGLVSLLKSKRPNLKIDFANLGIDLFKFQLSYESARSVCFKWGTQFYQDEKFTRIQTI